MNSGQPPQAPDWRLVMLQVAATLALWQGNDAADCELDPIDADAADRGTHESSGRTHD